MFVSFRNITFGLNGAQSASKERKAKNLDLEFLTVTLFKQIPNNSV